MEDYLEQLCINLGIKLVYTTNKITILSGEIKNNIPTIRVHRLLKNCPQDVAQAIVSFYTDLSNSDGFMKIIEDYSKEKFPSVNFKIRPSSEAFRVLTVEKMPSNFSYNNEDSSLGEYSISYIQITNFQGRRTTVKAGDALSPLEDDLLELDVVVEPPVT